MEFGADDLGQALQKIDALAFMKTFGVAAADGQDAGQRWCGERDQSRDPERFHEGKSVDFLQRLAEVVSAKLQSASSPGV